MVRKPNRNANGKVYVYWASPHNPNNARYPGHVHASVTDRAMQAAVDRIITGLLGHDRAAMLAATLPASQAEQDQRTQQHAEELRLRAAQNETAQNGLITQLARMGDDTSPAANAMRERITAQFGDLYTAAQAIQAELDALTASRDPPPTRPCSTSCPTPPPTSTTRPPNSRPASTPRSTSRPFTASP